MAPWVVRPSSSSGHRNISLISSPAQKVFPAPLITTNLIFVDFLIVRMASTRRSESSMLRTFLTSGRFRVTLAVSPSMASNKGSADMSCSFLPVAADGYSLLSLTSCPTIHKQRWKIGRIPNKKAVRTGGVLTAVGAWLRSRPTSRTTKNEPTPNFLRHGLREHKRENARENAGSGTGTTGRPRVEVRG